jgi:hypothetical protein
MKWPAKLRFCFAVTTNAELRLAVTQHIYSEQIGVPPHGFGDTRIRSGITSLRNSRVRRVAIGAADIVAPVLTAAEVVVLFLSGVTAKAGFRRLFRRFRFERNDFLRIAFFRVRLAWSMASLATGYEAFPTAAVREPRVRSVREGLELIFMAVLAGIAANVVFRLVRADFALIVPGNLRRAPGTEPDGYANDQKADQCGFDHFLQTSALLKYTFKLTSGEN